MKAATGVIEGLSLSQLSPGLIYDVDDFVGGQLIALNAAVEVHRSDEAIVTDDDDDKIERLSGGVKVIPTDTADERPEQRRRKRD